MTFNRIDNREKTKETWDAERMRNYLFVNYQKRSAQQIWKSFIDGKRLKFYAGRVTFELQQEAK